MVNEISNGLSNGKWSEATESDVGVRVEVGMCEVESGGMRVTKSLNWVKGQFHSKSAP